MNDSNENKTNKTVGNLQLVGFNIDDENYAIEIDNVKEINRMASVTRIPNTASFIAGVINLRGKVVPIIFLRKKLGLEQIEYNKRTRIVVTEILSNTVGFVVDSVSEVIRLDTGFTEPLPELAAENSPGYIKSIIKIDDKLVYLLDFEKLLSASELIVLSNPVINNTN